MNNFYVIGNKTSKSLSPTIFNHWFKKYKIKAKYDFIEIKKNNFHDRIKKILSDKKTIGLNITIPYKQEIIRHLDRLDLHARNINAVNCVSIKKSKTTGINTDWEGYYKTLPKVKNLKKKNIIIIGYGGAALAIHYALKTKGFKNIEIVNRTKKRLNFEENTRFTSQKETLIYSLPNADIVINTTPTNPISKKVSKFIDKKTTLSDIVYKPKETKFLKPYTINKKIYGINMLIEQAALSFRFWFGFKPLVDKKLLKILDKKIK